MTQGHKKEGGRQQSLCRAHVSEHRLSRCQNHHDHENSERSQRENEGLNGGGGNHRGSTLGIGTDEQRRWGRKPKIG